MIDPGNTALSTPLQKPRRKLWRRIAGWGAALIAVFFLGIFGLLEAVAHRPPRTVPTTLTTAEISTKDAQLKQLGLTVHDGSFLTEHPFAPPWTSHSLLLPSNWSSGPSLVKLLLGSHRVRADLLLADLDVLQPVMERAYGGWDSAAARGWNWDQWFANWRKMLAAKGTAEIPLDTAFAPVDAQIAFQRDNHTQIPLLRFSTSDGSQTAVLAAAPSAPCTEIRGGGRLFPIAANDPAQQVRTAKLWTRGAESFANANYIAMPSSYGTPQAVRCGNSWIPLKPIGRGKPGVVRLLRQVLKLDRPRIQRIGDGIVYARLPEFEPSNYEGVSQKGWPQRQPGDRILIVDLRDNGGGDAQYGMDVLRGWIDDSRMVGFDQVGHQLTSSCLFAPLKWNFPGTGPGLSATRLSSGDKQHLQHLLDLMAHPYPPGCPRNVDTTPPKWTYLQRRFAPRPGNMRIIALVNSGCGSDCEWMTMALASLPETIIVGANTFGVGGFIQPGYSVLPHTGLAYRIALGRTNIYGDNRSVEGYGLDVDVVVPQVNELETKQLRELAETVARE